MLLLSVKLLFGASVIQALCWTLLHSIWQGALLAIAAGIVILLTRKSGPAIRYNLLSVLLALFIVSAMVTFGLQLRAAGETIGSDITVVGRETAGSGEARGMVSAPAGATKGVAGAKTGISGVRTGVTISGLTTDGGGTSGQTIDRVVNYLNGHAFWVVLIWFVIFSVRLVRIMGHLGKIHRMRNYGTHSPSAYWRGRLQELAEGLKIRMRVTLLESEIVRVPMVTGFFRPVILVPFSLLAQMPPEQVEAVLLHELAHIRRGDYFINIVQHFAEILFFFNPGVLWISSLIREERENCCDDIAVKHTGSKKEFIHALVSFQEFNNAKVAVAFAGSRGHLLQRVKRIVYNDNKILDIREKFFLLGCLLVTGALTLAFSYLPPSSLSEKGRGSKALHEKLISERSAGGAPGAVNAVRAVGAPGAVDGIGAVSAVDADGPVDASDTTGKPVKKNAMTVKRDTADVGPDMFALPPDDEFVGSRKDTFPGWEKKKEEIRRAQEAIMEHQKKIADEQIRLWEEEAKLREEEMKLSGTYEALAEAGKQQGMDSKDMLNLILEQKMKNSDDNIQMMKEKEKLLDEYSRQSDVYKKKALKDMMGLLDKTKERQMDDRLKMQDDRRKMPDESWKEPDEVMMLKRAMDEQNRVNMEANEKDIEKQKERLEVNRLRFEAERMRRDLERVQREKEISALKTKVLLPILDYLHDEKLISDKSNFSFSITSDGLIVNGEKQPDALYHKIRVKYIPELPDDLTFSKKDGSESLSMNRHK